MHSHLLKMYGKVKGSELSIIRNREVNNLPVLGKKYIYIYMILHLFFSKRSVKIIYQLKLKRSAYQRQLVVSNDDSTSE